LALNYSITSPWIVTDGRMSKRNNGNDDWGAPHAFHLNLPPNHFDEDGVPRITKFAHKKARMIVDLALSIKLTEDMFLHDDNSDDVADSDEGEDDSKDTLVSRLLSIQRHLQNCWKM
jgi:hypothetical protein